MILNRFRTKSSNQYNNNTGNHSVVNEMAQNKLAQGSDGSEQWHELYLSDSVNNNSGTVADMNIDGNAQLKNVVWNDQAAGNQKQNDYGYQSNQAPSSQDIIKTAIGEGTIIEGKFKFESPVRIDGELTGEVVSSSVLIVGETAVVRAQIHVGTLIVFGKVIGDVVAEELVSIRSDGMLEGNINTKRIAIEDGGYFKGLINS